jgi:hypothetical protein
MTAQTVREAAQMLGVPTERVFSLAFDYAEERRSKKYLTKIFLDWYFKDKLHATVEDFVIDVLAKRTKKITTKRVSCRRLINKKSK